MTTLHHTIATPAQIVDAVSALGPAIRARAPEIEAGRRVPSDLLSLIVDAGAFRLLVPSAYGGAEGQLADALRMFEALARADASTAWTVMIGAGSAAELAALPAEARAVVYADGPDVIAAGVFSPSGTIEPVDNNGYRVNGRWGFASGCEHAQWIWGNCIEGVVDGHPQMRVAVFTPDQVVIEDTWHVSGLCGTGSHHFHVNDGIVPAVRTFRPLTEEPTLDAPIARVPAPASFSTAIGAVAVGIAQGALDDIVGLAADKVPLLSSTTLGENAHFHFQLANADAAVRAARALLSESAMTLWDRASAYSELTPFERARIRANAIWSVERATAAVEFAYRAGGGGALYRDSSLQRRLRDIEALNQHFLVRPDTLTTAGAILAGLEPELMVF
jgi:alkylation response protein AidB-like acyl-CoA dehydrogenase